MTPHSLKVAAVLIGLAIAPVPTVANTLIGDVISGSYHAPCDTCVITEPYGSFSYFTNPFVVPISNNTVETALFVGNPVFYEAWDVIVNSDNMTLTMAPAIRGSAQARQRPGLLGAE
jgi:hypothetical protein